jgi:hypothetical protein
MFDIISLRNAMQTIPTQDQLNRIETRLNHLTQLMELLLGKVEEEGIFQKLVKSERFQTEMREDLEAFKKDPTQFTDLYEAYRQQKTT